MTNFVVLAAQRTGSNLLCTLLNSHPAILCHHEIFNPRGPRYAITHRDGTFTLGTPEQRERDPIAFLTRVWRARCGQPCVGFKMTQGQNDRVLRHVLDDPSIKKIILRRRNRIKTYVSQRISQQLNEWEVYHPRQLRPDRPRIMVDVALLRGQIATNERFYREISDPLQIQPDSYINVEYEALLSRPLHRRLLDFLGVVPRDVELTPASIKQNPANLADLISNFAELADTLKGTDLEDELHSRDN